MSNSPEIEPLLDKWRDKVEELEGKPEEIKDEQDSFYKGSWDAARERAEPELKRKTIQSCIEDLEESGDSDDIIEALADWRKEADELDKRIMDSKEWFQSNVRRHQLNRCIEDLEEALPDDYFEECRRCESLKNPVSDKRHGKGFRWECTECVLP